MVTDFFEEDSPIGRTRTIARIMIGLCYTLLSLAPRSRLQGFCSSQKEKEKHRERERARERERERQRERERHTEKNKERTTQAYGEMDSFLRLDASL